MLNDTIRFISLETHPTHDIRDKHVNGSLTVVWRDWDKILEVAPKMIYVSSVNPGEIKGPHIHTKRDSYFVCIRGKVVFIAKDENGKYLESKTEYQWITPREINMFAFPTANHKLFNLITEQGWNV